MNEKEAEQLGEELKEAMVPYLDSFKASMESILSQSDLITDHLLRQQNTLALAVVNLTNGSRPAARVLMREFEDRSRELPGKLQALDGEVE